MRAFVAVEIPDTVRSFLASITSKVAPSLEPYRFTPAENLHITIQFLGEIDRSLISLIKERLQEACQSFEPFVLGVGRAGYFPDRGEARILHADVAEGEEKLRLLAASVRHQLASMGFKEDKPFAPHITLARRKDRSGSSKPGTNWGLRWSQEFNRALEDSLRPEGKDEAQGKTARLTWTVDRVRLMESILRPSAPIYVPVADILLGSTR